MTTGAITEYIDVAQLVLYAFWIFFFGLILYLHRESKREGYPLETDGRQRRVRVVGFPGMPAPKTYLMPHGGGTRTLPRPEPESGGYALAAEPVARHPGAPLHPTGNPMVDGVGPAAWAIRPDVPDLTHEGGPKIVPMRIATDFSVEERDPDPRGKPVIGTDGVVGGTVTDIWVDQSEPQIRYFELALSGAETPAPEAGTDTPAEQLETPAGSVLLPINFARISGKDGHIKVFAITGAQFTDVPATASRDQVTLQEEDRITAFYGGGHLYATSARLEPLL